MHGKGTEMSLPSFNPTFPYSYISKAKFEITLCLWNILQDISWWSIRETLQRKHTVLLPQVGTKQGIYSVCIQKQYCTFFLQSTELFKVSILIFIEVISALIDASVDITSCKSEMIGNRFGCLCMHECLCALCMHAHAYVSVLLVCAF